MRNKWPSLAALFVLAAIAGSAVASQSEPNAFIDKPTPTMESLLGAVRSDAVVMSRFMRHFGMTREEVVAYLGSLKRGAIRKDGAYLIYNTPESGEIRARVLFYRKGTAVWMDEAGNYILKLSCGNPMVRGTDYRPADDPDKIAMKSFTDVRALVTDPPRGIDVGTMTRTKVPPVLPETAAITFTTVPPMDPVFEDSPQVFAPIGLIIPYTAGILVSSGAPIPEPGSLLAFGIGV
ncbi:MAG: hypothetical protein IH945_12090, partial [Armatimonadetes bacterium]|nr:hypothetical protein [Armatimonadota bacterium]